MTSDDAKTVLRHPEKVLVLTALSYVNLSDIELKVLILRYLRGHTQEQVAEEIERSKNGVQKIEYVALDRCAAVWKNLIIVKEMLKTTL